MTKLRVLGAWDRLEEYNMNRYKRHTLALNLRWMGRNTKRPRPRLAAVAALITRLVSENAFVTT